MKKILRIILINIVAVAITAYVVPGISYLGGPKALLIIALVFAIVNIFVKPIIKLLALPVEILTLGLFSTIINASMLLLVARFVPSLKINGFYFTGLSNNLLTLKPFYIPSLGTALIGSLIIGIISTLLYWISE